jgi:hypothetical protein
MFIINPDITDLQVKDRSIFRILYSMNSHPVAVPDMSVEDARCYILFFSEGPNLSAYIGLYLPHTDRKIFYSYSTNPFPFEAAADVEADARTFAEDMGFLLDEINVSGMAADDRNHWFEEQEMFTSRVREAQEDEEAEEVEASEPEPPAAETPASPGQEAAAEEPAESVEEPEEEPEPESEEEQPVAAEPAPAAESAPRPAAAPEVPAEVPAAPAAPSAAPAPMSPQREQPAPENAYPPPAQPVRPYQQPSVNPGYPPPQPAAPQQPLAETGPLETGEQEASAAAAAQQVPHAAPARQQGKKGTSAAPPVRPTPPAKHTAGEEGPFVDQEIAADVRQERPQKRPVRTASLFEEAVRQSLVKPPRPKAQQTVRSSAGHVTRDKEALARLLASF